MNLRSGWGLALLIALSGALVGWWPSPAAPTTLAEVVAALNRAAPEIRSVSAHAEVSDYTALVQDTSRSSGTFAYRRTSKGPMYALDLTTPPEQARRLVYRDQTAWLYTPTSKEVVKYPLGSQRALLDQYLSLGIGATGDELAKSYQLALAGEATLGGEATVRLRLTPRDPAAAARLPRIELWYSTTSWIAVQQQFFQPGGDYHLVQFSDVRRNAAIPDRAFSTDFPGATVVKPKS